MIYHQKLAFTLLLILVVINSCSQKLPPKKAINLNNMGVKCLMEFPTNDKTLDSAIIFFNQALQLDSTYVIAYMNLTTAYNRKHNYKNEMLILNKVIGLHYGSPQVILTKGMLFERMNNVDSAKQCYQTADIKLQKKLIKNPNDVGLIEELIFLKAIANGKDAAIAETNEQIKKHPDLTSKLTGQYSFYKYFDRHNTIFGLPTEITSNK
jgi:tetratricopeptide (TPR) repeat protein